jgi:hypothetical protein
MAFFSIENLLQNKIIKNLININTNIINDIQTNIVRQENIYTPSSLSLIHPRNCQPKIPKKDLSTLIETNLKTMDDVFDIQSAIKSVLSHSEDIEYNLIQPYHKWSCENFSEEYGYTHFYIIISLISEETESPYYAIEVERTKGTKRVIYYVLNELKERINIL